MSIFYAASPQVQRVQKVQKVQRVVGKVLKIDRPIGRRVLKFDGPTGRGLWYRPAGDEFYNSALQNGKPNNRASPDGNAPLLPTAPLHGKACHWIFGSFHSPTNPVPLPPEEACHWIFGSLRFPTNPVPLPPRRGKSALCLAFGLIQYEQHYGELAAIAATPYPASPDFSTGKRLTWFSGRFAPLRTKFACHPYSEGRIGRSMFTYRVI